MKNLEQLSIKEMRSVNGGDWIKDLGAAAHNAWCTLKSTVSAAVEVINEAGKGNRLHSAG